MRSACQLPPTSSWNGAHALGSLPTDGRLMVIIMSVIHLDLVSVLSQQRKTNLFLIDSDMTMSMPVVMSMSMTVSVVVMTTCRVHPEQIDCQSNTAHPKQSVDSHELGWVHTVSSASSGGVSAERSLHSLYGLKYDEDRYQNQETA